jgi:hypothetical protein
MWGTFDEASYAEFLAAATERYSEKEDLACNKPKAETHNGKSHVVKACFGGKEKLIRFGDANMTTAGPPKEGESDKIKARRASFKARHAKNIARGPVSGAYWANKVKW